MFEVCNLEQAIRAVEILAKANQAAVPAIEKELRSVEAERDRLEEALRSAKEQAKHRRWQRLKDHEEECNVLEAERDRLKEQLDACRTELAESYSVLKIVCDLLDTGSADEAKERANV